MKRIDPDITATVESDAKDGSSPHVPCSPPPSAAIRHGHGCGNRQSTISMKIGVERIGNRNIRYLISLSRVAPAIFLR